METVQPKRIRETYRNLPQTVEKSTQLHDRSQHYHISGGMTQEPTRREI